MLTETAKDGLRLVLQYSSSKDLKIMELKLVSGDLREKSVAEMIEDMLSSASQPSDILRQQRLRKRVLGRYLYHCGLPVTQEQSKSDYIRICLEMWQVRDDNYLWRFRTDEEIAAVIDRFEKSLRQSLGEMKRRLREKRPSTKTLGSMQRSMDKILQTINAVGTTTTTSPSEAEIPIPPFSRSSSDRDDEDDDDDDSSSSSSVEIIECQESSPDRPFLQCSSSMDTTEPSSLFTPSTSEPSSSRNASQDVSQSKTHGAKTASEQRTPSKPRPSGAASTTPEDKSPSKRSPTKRGSSHIKEDPDSRDPKQKSIDSYFNGTEKR